MACGIWYKHDALPGTLDFLLKQACLLKKEKSTHDSTTDKGN